MITNKNYSSTVTIPNHDYDLTLVLPSGEKITLEFRVEGTFPSLDVCFEKQRSVINWGRNMVPAPQCGKHVNERDVFQLWIGLDPNQPAY